MITDHEFTPRVFINSCGFNANDWSRCGHVVNYNHNSSTADVDYCNCPSADHAKIATRHTVARQESTSAVEAQ